jgi:hypothetical protein
MEIAPDKDPTVNSASVAKQESCRSSYLRDSTANAPNAIFFKISTGNTTALIDRTTLGRSNRNEIP